MTGPPLSPPPLHARRPFETVDPSNVVSLDGAQLVQLADMLAERLGAGTGEQSPWLTVGEAADYLRCAPKRIYDLLSQGRLPRHKDGSRVLLHRAELDAYLAGTLLTPASDLALQRGSRRDGRMTDPGVAA
jgi:excisionase family DNA binding protein